MYKWLQKAEEWYRSASCTFHHWTLELVSIKGEGGRATVHPLHLHTCQVGLRGFPSFLPLLPPGAREQGGLSMGLVGLTVLEQVQKQKAYRAADSAPEMKDVG